MFYAPEFELKTRAAKLHLIIMLYCIAIELGDTVSH